jgi:arabinogalactan endo-1,4-beta-galactosidase
VEASLMGGGNIEKAVKQWNELVLKTLREKSKGQDYVQIVNENLGGISIAMFCKRSIS